MRTFALLGVHGLRRGHRGDGAELGGRQGFSRDPARRRSRARSRRWPRTSASRPPRPACWRRRRSSTPSPTPGARRAWPASVPLVVDPVCASMHGDPLLHPSALDSLRSQLFPLATLVTPNLDEVRLLVDIDVVDDASQREAARALHALGPAVGAGQGRTPAVVAAQPRPAVRRHRLLRVRRRPHRHRPRSRRGRHAGRRGRQRAGPRLHRARRGRVRETLGDRMSARRIPVGPRPRPGVGAVQTAASVNLDADRGHRARARRQAPRARRADPRRRRQPGVAAADEDLRRVGRAAAGSRCATTCRTGGGGRRARRRDPPPPTRPASSRRSSWPAR